MKKQASRRVLGSRAGSCCPVAGNRERFPKELTRDGLLILLMALFSFSPLPHISFAYWPGTSSQAASLITSSHFNFAELGACELQRKFMQNAQQTECAGILETSLTLSAPFVCPSSSRASHSLKISSGEWADGKRGGITDGVKCWV